MSWYVHAKVIRLPVPEELMAHSDEDIDTILTFCFEGLYEKRYSLPKYIDIEYTDKGVYLDYVYYRSYDDPAIDFGYSRYLTVKEIKKAKAIFDKLNIAGIEYSVNDLRVVEYSYYNCSECTDYYEATTEEKDDSELL